MVAAQRARDPELLDILRQWAEDKFHLPWSHECFQGLTTFELLTMFWEDYYRKNPTETKRTGSGELIYKNTGDSLVDKWESEIERGLEPDLYEGLDPRVRERAINSKSQLQQQQFDIEKCLAADGFADDYSKNL